MLARIVEDDSNSERIVPSMSECESCEVFRDRIDILEVDLKKAQEHEEDFATSTRRALSEYNRELEEELLKTGTKLQRTMNFLRLAEDRANENRAKIRSLEEELRLVRDESNPDFQKKQEVRKALQLELEQLRNENQQLKTRNLQHLSNTLTQKQRAVWAEKESDLYGDRVRALADSLANNQRNFQKALGEAHRQLVHQTRRADQQREARIRLEVENEELRRPRPFMQRVREIRLRG
ncbi:hypothetical protein NPX13_g9985 [Xylaria arbuscula]|uniref:Uncharacterized protein n=1 Tax=Xylaria arbuscula TaxID=114810 RepID=A0A9W8N5L9_9PEZI|nr:hypothetical protein NPX13_g9985 [Xylaria arbuscula]